MKTFKPLTLIIFLILFLSSFQLMGQFELDTTTIYRIVLKDGKVHSGTIFKELREVILLKKSNNEIVNIQRKLIKNLEPVIQQKDIEQTLWRIVMTDGNEYFGNIIVDEEAYIILDTKVYGQQVLGRRYIKLIEQLEVESLEKGKIWLENLQATRYFWAPNGYGLEKREGYYQNIWVLFNQASIGITDYFSLGAGTVPLFLFDGAPTPVFVVPKFSFPIIENKLNVGVGAIAGTIVGEDDLFDGGSSFGILYGVATYGNKNTNVTLGGGMAFAGGEFAKNPMFTLGGMARIGRRSYLLTENYFIKLDDFWIGLITLGGRTVWQRVSLDYGGVIPVSNDFEGFIVIPWLSLSVPFQY